MAQIPRDVNFDSTLALVRDPYGFVSNRCRRYGADLFQTRLMLQSTICMTGSEAGQLFCDPARFMRAGASPERIRRTLLGRGGVQGLDDEAHRHRKQMFMSLMSAERISDLARLAEDQLKAAARKWQSIARVTLYDELHEVLARAVCAWSGVPLPEADVERRTRELAAMFDYAGAIGPKHWWSRLARRRAERWIEGVVDEIRHGNLDPPQERAAYTVALHRDIGNELLDRRVAAVELLNVLRPMVAVSVFITFLAHALREHPDWREKLAIGRDDDAELFVQEVRRFYPFFPAITARVRRDFEWKGYAFPRGTRVMFDLYGVNHNARTRTAPEEFRPGRFEEWGGNAFNFVPQGVGDHYRDHRCPGEWIAIELMKRALRFFVQDITYEVPEQDLRIDRSRLPALPRSGFIICNVRLRT